MLFTTVFIGIASFQVGNIIGKLQGCNMAFGIMREVNDIAITAIKEKRWSSKNAARLDAVLKRCPPSQVESIVDLMDEVRRIIRT